MSQENLLQAMTQAARDKYRFPSIKGEITFEQLWELPMSAKTGFDLDNVAKTVNANLKELGEESFVPNAAALNPKRAKYDNMMALVKYVIATKHAENQAALAAATNRQQLGRLMEILEKKEQASLENMTPEQIKAEIARLSGTAVPPAA